MGGSGGGSYFSGRTSAEELRKQVLDAEERTQDEAFETNASGLLNSVLADVNSRNADALRQHMETLQQALETEIEGTVDLRFGGSVARHTFVDGLSDADALVILNKSELREFTPAQVRAYFAERLNERLPNSEVEVGRLAVTVKFGDIDVQLIPALRVGSAVRIPEGDGERWSEAVQPDRFARELTRVNQSLNSKLVPTVKLAKVMIAGLPEQHRLSGYHTEALAIRVFESYQGPRSTKAMLRHFFNKAPKLVREPITDTTGQSARVDEYLGKAGSLQRRIVADALARIGRSIVTADRSRSVEQWQDLLG